MIAAGRVAEADAAVEELRAALAAAGISLPLVVDPHVWDTPKQGSVRLVQLGTVLPEVAVRLAGLVRKGVAES